MQKIIDNLTDLIVNMPKKIAIKIAHNIEERDEFTSKIIRMQPSYWKALKKETGTSHLFLK